MVIIQARLGYDGCANFGQRKGAKMSVDFKWQPSMLHLKEFRWYLAKQAEQPQPEIGQENRFRIVCEPGASEKQTSDWQEFDVYPHASGSLGRHSPT